MHKNRSVDVHQFAMIPRADIPRSSFSMQKTLKTTFDSGYLVPILCEEVLPGDTFRCHATMFSRLATPLFPFMDNMYLESFFFFVPNRLLWDNWEKFMGSQDNPGDSTSYNFPSMLTPNNGYAVGSIFDHFGLPTTGQYVTVGTPHASLPLRAYNLIWNAWFRDENLQNSVVIRTTDSGDLAADFALLRRGKRHDYFTSCLPFAQKGTAVPLTIGTSAPVKTSAVDTFTGNQSPLTWNLTGGTKPTASNPISVALTSGITYKDSIASLSNTGNLYPSNLYADLSAATLSTINQLRLSFQTQKLLERDARGGTRYTEVVFQHFGVKSPDARLQRPEYLGGGRSPITINPIAQTSATSITGGTTPQGNLAAVGTSLAQGHGFSQSFVEHGYIIGLVSVQADLTYQQGLRRHWSRLTRYDFYFPAFAMLGEQAVLNKEIYCDGSANDNNVFGYQERWAEYRYNPSEIHGLFRSTAAGTLDAWHLSQKFTALPTLNSTFIQDTPPVSRVVAVPSAPQFLMDAFFDVKAARPLPLYSVPGLIDHF